MPCTIGYGDRKGTAISQLHPEDEDEDADIFSFAGRDKGQTKLAFGSDLAAGGKKQATTGSTGTKAKNSTAKGKGKGKQVVVDSEEESEAESSHTLDGDNRVMDIDELDDEDTPLQPTAGYGKRGNAASGRGTSRTGRSGGTRKIPSATVMIDDSDSDSDSGLTFKVRLSLAALAPRGRLFFSSCADCSRSTTPSLGSRVSVRRQRDQAPLVGGCEDKRMSL